jgi:hypothetical protein
MPPLAYKAVSAPPPMSSTLDARHSAADCESPHGGWIATGTDHRPGFIGVGFINLTLCHLKEHHQKFNLG